MITKLSKRFLLLSFILISKYSLFSLFVTFEVYRSQKSKIFISKKKNKIMLIFNCDIDDDNDDD